MKKKKYEKPSLEVVVLKQQPTLLQASANATIDQTEWEEVDV